MKETIKQMTEDGFAARKISRKLNLDFEYVRKIIKDNNYFLLKENFDDSKITGHSGARIACAILGRGN